MSRSNYDKPFYVDIGTSIVAVRCASNHDVVLEYDHVRLPQSIGIAEAACERMNEEAELSEERAVEHATRHVEAVARDNCRDCVHNPSGKNYEGGNAAAMREALVSLRDQELRMLEGNVRHCIGLTVLGLERACKIMRGVIEEALAAPQRNCDLYDTQPTMSMAYEAYRKAAMRSYGNGLTGAVPTVKQKPMTYDEWLLAPAAERKGDYDGR